MNWLLKDVLFILRTFKINSQFCFVNREGSISGPELRFHVSISDSAIPFPSSLHDLESAEKLQKHRIVKLVQHLLNRVFFDKSHELSSLDMHLKFLFRSSFATINPACIDSACQIAPPIRSFSPIMSSSIASSYSNMSAIAGNPDRVVFSRTNISTKYCYNEDDFFPSTLIIGFSCVACLQRSPSLQFRCSP